MTSPAPLRSVGNRFLLQTLRTMVLQLFGQIFEYNVFESRQVFVIALIRGSLLCIFFERRAARIPHQPYGGLFRGEKKGSGAVDAFIDETFTNFCSRWPADTATFSRADIYQGTPEEVTWNKTLALQAVN